MLKKAFTALTVLATVVYTVGLAAFVPTASAATSGSLIKASGAAVYYMGGDGKRYVFPDQKTYLTWYSDFSSVITISDAELASIQIGGNVTARPGVKLVKITTDPKVYAVGANGSLHWITTEAIAVALYGANWASMVNDVPDAFFVNYTVGSDITDASQYSPSAETAAATSINVDKGIGTDTTGPVLSTGSVTVSLAADTPAGQTVPTGASVEAFKFNLKAGSTKAAISSITLTAGGLGDATKIDDAALYVDGVKVGSSKNFNSDRVATFTFTTPLEIAANAVKSVAVRVTFAADGFYSLGVASASHITAGGSVMGSFPVNGNTMQSVAGNLAQITLSNPTGTDTTNQFGEDDVLLAGFDLTTSNDEPVLWTSAAFRNGGTNSADIVSNLRLIVDGEEIATGSLVDGYVTFDINNFFIDKSETVSVEVRGDIGVGSANDTVKLYIKDRADLKFVGQYLGYGAQLTTASHALLDSTGDAGVVVVTLSVSDISIDMDKAATPAKDVLKGTNDVVLATFSILSSGEDVVIGDIADTTQDTDFFISGNGIVLADLENIEMVDTHTKGVFSITATDADTDGTIELNLDDEDIYLTKGVKRTFQIRADIKDTANDGDSYKVTITSNAFQNVTGQTSNADITASNITPNNVSSAVTTVKAGSLTVSPVALTSKTVVPATSGVTIYQAALKAGSSDDVKLTSFKLSVTDLERIFTDNNVSQVQLYLDGVLLKTLSNQIVEANGSCDNTTYTTNDTCVANAGTWTNSTVPATITFNSLSTVNNANVITKGATEVLTVVASFSSSFAGAGDVSTNVANIATDIDSKAVTSNDSITESGTNAVTSRTVTLAASGSLSVELKTGTTKTRSSNVLAGASTAAGEYLAEIVFNVQNEPVKVTDLLLENKSASSTHDDLRMASLLDGNGNVVASEIPVAGGHFKFEDIDLVFEANKSTSLWLSVQTKSINGVDTLDGTATPGRTIKFAIADTNSDLDGVGGADLVHGVTAEGVNTSEALTQTAQAVLTTPAGGNVHYTNRTVESEVATIVAVKLVSVENALADSIGGLTTGSDQIIGKFKFTFDRGGNRKTTDSTDIEALLSTLNFTSNTVGATVANYTIYLQEGNSGDRPLTGDLNFSGAELGAMTENSFGTETITLVVVADVTALAAGANSVQISLDLSLTALQYVTDYGAGTTTVGDANGEINLPYSKVTGGKTTVTF